MVLLALSRFAALKRLANDLDTTMQGCELRHSLGCGLRLDLRVQSSHAYAQHCRRDGCDPN
jgi:hypothetical protein